MAKTAAIKVFIDESPENVLRQIISVDERITYHTKVPGEEKAPAL